MPIYSRAGYQTAIILRQPTTQILIADTNRIVKTAFRPKLAANRKFGKQEVCLPDCGF
jgi:uncharacterized protein (DUF1015 family)